MIGKLKTELIQVPLRDLKNAPWNNYKLAATKEEHQNLKDSMLRDGSAGVLPIRETDDGFEVIDGRHRLPILEELGWDPVNCENFGKISKAEAITISERRNYQWFKTDEKLLLNLFREEVIPEIPVDDLRGFMAVDDPLISKLDDPQAPHRSDPNDVLEPPQNPKTKPSQKYLLGRHELICIDATDADAVKKFLAGRKPVLMVTDPPYGVSYNPSWRLDVKGRKGAVRAVGKVKNDDLVDWSAALKLFPGNVIYTWHSGQQSSETQRALEIIGFKIYCQIIWKKNHFALSRGNYHWQHEPCWYAIRKGKKSNWQGSRKESTVWEIQNLNAFGGKRSGADERTAHSTQKPTECMARPIRNNTEEGDLIYDPFCGSGSTIIAAEMEARRCLAVEIDPAWCDVTVQRWEKFTGKKAKLVEEEKA